MSIPSVAAKQTAAKEKPAFMGSLKIPSIPLKTRRIELIQRAPKTVLRTGTKFHLSKTSVKVKTIANKVTKRIKTAPTNPNIVKSVDLFHWPTSLVDAPNKPAANAVTTMVRRQNTPLRTDLLSQKGAVIKPNSTIELTQTKIKAVRVDEKVGVGTANTRTKQVIAMTSPIVIIKTTAPLIGLVSILLTNVTKIEPSAPMQRKIPPTIATNSDSQKVQKRLDAQTSVLQKAS